MPPTSSPSCRLTVRTLARSFPSSVFRLPVPVILRPRLPSILRPDCVRSLSSASLPSPDDRPAQPSPAAHPRQVTPSPGRAEGAPVRLWVMSSPPPHHRPTSRQQTAGQPGRASGGLPSCPPHPRPSSSRQVVRVGQSTSQGGRSLPVHPADPPPCRGAWAYMRIPQEAGRGSGNSLRAAEAAP